MVKWPLILAKLPFDEMALVKWTLGKQILVKWTIWQNGFGKISLQ
jgi:hypothetical protein